MEIASSISGKICLEQTQKRTRPTKLLDQTVLDTVTTQSSLAAIAQIEVRHSYFSIQQTNHESQIGSF